MRFVIVFIHTVVCYGMCTIFCEGLMQVVSCKHFFIIVVFPPPCTLSTRKNNCFFFFAATTLFLPFFLFFFLTLCDALSIKYNDSHGLFASMEG